ncbi:MAG: hypothetical protein O3A01_03175 [bacterium]|nr:hypothetical protein [bacterium]
MSINSFVRALILLFGGMLGIIYSLQFLSSFSGGISAIVAVISLLAWMSIWAYFFPPSSRPGSLIAKSRLVFYVSLVLVIVCIFPSGTGASLLAKIIGDWVSPVLMGSTRLVITLVCIVAGIRSLLIREVD